VTILHRIHYSIEVPKRKKRIIGFQNIIGFFIITLGYKAAAAAHDRTVLSTVDVHWWMIRNWSKLSIYQKPDSRLVRQKLYLIFSFCRGAKNISLGNIEFLIIHQWTSTVDNTVRSLIYFTIFIWYYVVKHFPSFIKSSLNNWCPIKTFIVLHVWILFTWHRFNLQLL
jgi:hypothetical protein